MMTIAVFIPATMDSVKEPKLYFGYDAEQKAQRAFFEHTGVEYSVFLAAEDKEALLAVTDTVGSKIISIQPHQIQETYENLDEDGVDCVREVISNLNDAKHYTDKAHDKISELPGTQSERIGNLISQIYQQLELVETMITDTYPQAV